jgi:hypothetical protein
VGADVRFDKGVLKGGGVVSNLRYMHRNVERVINEFMGEFPGHATPPPKPEVKPDEYYPYESFLGEMPLVRCAVDLPTPVEIQHGGDVRVT